MRALLLLTIIVILSGCQTLTPSGNGTCEQISQEHLFLKGSTDDAMANCVLSKDLSSLSLVTVNSFGGSVESALKIGSALAAHSPHIIVDENCNSSCANYFLPIASKVTVKPKSQVMIHGSLDVGIGKKHKMASLWDTIEAQDNYARTHKIHPGWLSYRYDYSGKGMSTFPYLSGNFDALDAGGRIGMFVVTPEMMRSCLPDVEITFQQPDYINYTLSSETRKRQFIKQDARPTGNWRCIDGFDYKDLAPPDFAQLRKDYTENNQ